MKKSFYLMFLSAGLFLTACDKEEVIESADYKDELNNIGSNVIIPTYKNLADAGVVLQTAIQKLQSDPSAANLTAARKAWVDMRVFWEQAEGFLFGPVDQEGIDPSIDSWPVNVVDLNAVLASSDALTVTYLNSQEGTLKGFHTIEFLLWGENGDKTVDQLSVRQFEYLTACAGALAGDTKKLYDLWSPSSGNFIANLTKAGVGSILYVSEKAALEEVANALVVIADEVGNGKINDPFAASDVTLEESRFSANSKSDFSDNIRSVKNIYTGTYGTTGNGISLTTIVKAKNEALDTKIRAQIDAAINAILAIDGTFTQAITSSRPSIAAAQAAVRDLQETLESELVPLVSNL